MRPSSTAMPDFRAEPLVAGALGSVDAVMLGRMMETQRGLKVRVRRPGLIVVSDPPVEYWAKGTHEGWHWNPLNGGVRPRSWREAQLMAMSSGVTVEGEQVVLHNDLLGMQPLFFFEHAEGIYFSNWLPLLAAAAPTLSVDPAAWASILVLGFALPGSSPFAEIHSLPHGSAVIVGPHSISRLDSSPVPSWAGSRAATISDVVRDLHSGMPAPSQRRALTLSGGWDSRLLLGLAAREGRQRLAAWTTSTEDGSDLDLELARPVAEHLGVEHIEVVPDVDSWAPSSSAVMKRFSHQTWMHAWLEPLAAAMRPVAVQVIDGLAGDVLFKGLFQNPADDANGSSVRARRDLWERLGGGRSVRDDVWSPEALALFDEMAFPSFDAYIAPLTSRPTWQAISVLTTRTARGVALSPLRLFGPELSVRLPFLTPAVIGAAFSEVLHCQRGGALYRELLGATDPRLAGLPSTNDVTRGSARAVRRQEHPAAIQRFVDVIGAVEPALRLLAPQLRDAIVDSDVEALARAARWNGPLAGLQAVHVYADWCLTYPTLRGGLK